MKIAYLIKANLDTHSHLINKIFDQVSMWTKSNSNIKVGIFCLSETLTSSSKLDSFDTRNYYVGKKEFYEIFYLFPIYKNILRDLFEFSPDIIYTRTWTPRKFSLKFIRDFNVISEVNTKELDEYKLYANHSIKSGLKYLYYKYTQRQFYNKLKGICCVTYEIEKDYLKFNIPSCVVPNSLPLENYELAKPVKNKTPKIFFIGTPGMPWHGVDVIVKLAKLTIGKLEFHVVGDDTFKTDKIPENVYSYGFLSKDKYVSILKMCDIGLGTLAIYRKKMAEACPLKVREYLAHGLPIIIPYIDTAFFDSNPHWVLKIPYQEGEILKPENVEKIIKFSQEMQGFRVTHKEVASFISSDHWEKERIKFFTNIFKNLKVK